MRWACIPSELQTLSQWVCWRYEEKNGKPTKVPVDPVDHTMTDGTNASFSFSQCIESAYSPDKGGIGFSFRDGVFGVDYDHVLDPTTHDLLPEWDHLRSEIDALNSYTEISPSGEGLHVYARMSDQEKWKDGKAHKKGNCEIYFNKRFFTVTGDEWGPTKGRPFNASVQNEVIQAIIERIEGAKKETHREKERAGWGKSLISDDEILARLFREKEKGEDWKRLYYEGNISGYNSQSEADLALCAKLAFYSRCDKGVMNKLFRGSELYRDKWDEKHGNETYGKMTILKACESCSEVYGGVRKDNNQSGEKEGEKPSNYMPEWEEDVLPSDKEGEYPPEEKNTFAYKGYPALTNTLADIAKYYMNNATRPRRECAYFFALLMGASICGRVITYHNNTSCVYALCIGRSGTGKNDIITMQSRLCGEIGCYDLIGTGDCTSDSGVHSSIYENPRALAISDEFGLMFNNQKTNGIARTGLTHRTKAFTSVMNNHFRNKKFADPCDEHGKLPPKMRDIRFPCQSLLGLAEPNQLRAISAEDVLSGDMARYLFWNCPEYPTTKKEKYTQRLPEKTREKIRKLLLATGGKEDTETKEITLPKGDHELGIFPRITIKDDSKEGENYWNELDYNQQCMTMKMKEGWERTLKTRELEKAARIAIVLHVLGGDVKNFKKLPMKREELENALHIVRKSHDVLKELFHKRSDFTPEQMEKARKMYKVIREEWNNGERNIYEHKILQKAGYSGRFDVKTRNAVRLILSDKGICTNEGGKGRPVTFFYFP